MTPEASKIYFDLFEKTSSMWSGSAEEFNKLATGAIREFFGSRISNLGNRLLSSGRRAGGDEVLHPTTGEMVGFHRLTRDEKMEVLRRQAAAHSEEMAAQASRHADELESARRAGASVGDDVAEAAGEAAAGAGRSTPGELARRGLIGGALLGTGGAGLYYLGRKSGEEGALNNRNLAFGGGLAAGLAAPHVLTGVNQIVANQGLLPTGPYSPGNFQRI